MPDSYKGVDARQTVLVSIQLKDLVISILTD